MNLFKSLPLVGVLVIFASGCGSPSGRVEVTPSPPAGATAKKAEIEMFDVAQPPERAYREVAQLTYEGVPGEFLDVVREFRIKARELGADAIILDDPVGFTGD